MATHGGYDNSDGAMTSTERQQSQRAIEAANSNSYRFQRQETGWMTAAPPAVQVPGHDGQTAIVKSPRPSAATDETFHCLRVTLK